jgi:mono/diheme cytochrome c family protein
MTGTGRRRAVVITILAIAMAGACGDGGESSSNESAGDLELGKKVYNGACAMCHGADLRGTTRGPSHLSKVYEPSHHADGAYRAAIRNGVRAHHWNFGDMPALPDMPDDYVDAVIAYIRSEQVKQGFEPYPPPK